MGDGAPTRALPALTAIEGVRLGAVEAGIRYADRLDLVAIEFAPGTRAAAVFTRNAFCAAPVQLARQHLNDTQARPRQLLINTGNANAGTGQAGLDAAARCCAALAEAASIEASEVLPFSTGVIGEDLPVERIVDAIPALLASLDAGGWADAAQGILTTDTRPKGASRSVTVGERRFTLTGIAKGSGMLRPNMATMLGFLATDAPIADALLNDLLVAAVERSFHCITVDGDTSTNDAVLFAATGASAGTLIERGDSAEAQALGEALTSLCIELAQELVRDGEGASKFVAVEVAGGRTEAECREVAFTIAHSPLVKTALFASDPNWGRILAAIGRAGIDGLDVDGVSVAINDLPIAAGGERSPDYDEDAVGRAMSAAELALRVNLGRGASDATVWTSDFSYDYVRINAEYRS